MIYLAPQQIIRAKPVVQGSIRQWAATLAMLALAACSAASAQAPAADPATVSKPSEPSYTTKIAACRAALEIAFLEGASEIHLFGMGSTTTIKKDAKQKGMKSFVYWPSARSRVAPFVPRRRISK